LDPRRKSQDQGKRIFPDLEATPLKRVDPAWEAGYRTCRNMEGSSTSGREEDLIGDKKRVSYFEGVLLDARRF